MAGIGARYVGLATSALPQTNGPDVLMANTIISKDKQIRVNAKIAKLDIVVREV